MTSSESPQAYDNRLWTPASDDQLHAHMMGERTRLQNDDSLLPHLLAREGPLLDYGCGPGLLSGGVISEKKGAYAFDPSEVMRASATRYLGEDHVFDRIDAIPNKTFTRVWCCLVLCIIDDATVQSTLEAIREKMTDDGLGLFTICNPALCRTPKTRLDMRFPGNLDPEQEGILPKWKLEGGYGVYERHRPTKYYETKLANAGFQVQQMILTPPYDLDGEEIPGDFLCFKCSPQ